MKALSYVFIGALFSLGLVLAGMTDPQKIIGFLDFSGHFDPSLLLVMLGAVLVHGVAYRLISQQPSPLWAKSFSLPPPARIDTRLILGSGLFGVGWGLAGYCPGPALTSTFAFEPTALAFLGGMIAGMLLFTFSRARSRATQP